MHAQAATRDAEAQQLQLSALLQTALEQLGCAPSPSPAAAARSASRAQGLSSPGSLAAKFRSSVEDFSRIRASRQAALEQAAEPPAAQASSASVPRERAGFSGFTVYSNGVEERADAGSRRAAEVDGRFGQDQPDPADDGAGELRSSVEWRDIAAAARASWEPPAGRSEAPGGAAAGGPSAEPSNATGPGPQRPAPLVLPTALLATAQQGKATSSLVQMGASLVSPQAALARSQADLLAALREAGDASGEPTPLPLGTFLSPTLEGMARWKGQRARPRDHIAAVFRDAEDMQFYAPFSGTWMEVGRGLTNDLRGPGRGGVFLGELTISGTMGRRSRRLEWHPPIKPKNTSRLICMIVAGGGRRGVQEWGPGTVVCQRLPPERLPSAT